VGEPLAGACVGEEAAVPDELLETAVVAPCPEGDDADVLDELHPVDRSATAATADRANDVRRGRGAILIKKTSLLWLPLLMFGLSPFMTMFV
jgi:hypothetical protein